MLFRRLEWHCFHFALFMTGVEREHLTAYAAGLYVVHRVFTLQLSAPVAYKWLLVRARIYGHSMAIFSFYYVRQNMLQHAICPVTDRRKGWQFLCVLICTRYKGFLVTMFYDGYQIGKQTVTMEILGTFIFYF